jgi:hypothetical protein
MTTTGGLSEMACEVGHLELRIGGKDLVGKIWMIELN